jgi:glycosyltransferase involved in cell wall biosynthesis
MTNLEQETSLRFRSFDELEPVVVSICTITFNHARFIVRCIEGFLEQRCPFRTEIIIYDDASTDGTREMLISYAEKYPGIIRLIKPDRNTYSLGINPYYSFVLPQARGRYIAICDGDDYWRDEYKLLTQVQFLEDNPRIALTYGPALAERDNEQRSGVAHGAQFDLSPSELRSGAGINTLTAVFRNPDLRSAPKFLNNAPLGDMSLWALLGYIGAGKFLPNLPPAVYRIHDGGVFSEKNFAAKDYMSILTFVNIAAYHDTRGDTRSEKALLEKALILSIKKVGIVRFLAFAIGVFAKRLKRAVTSHLPKVPAGRKNYK